MKEVAVELRDRHLAPLLCGRNDEILRLLEHRLHVDFALRDNRLTVRGEPHAVDRAETVIERIVKELYDGRVLSRQEVQELLQEVRQSETASGSAEEEVVFTTPRGRKIRPRTEGQRRYVEALRQNEVVFAIGPAGTGKTYLAVAMAVAALRRQEVVRLVLVRPTVEAGERLGYLPGPVEEKVEPYLRPLYDALYDLILAEKFQALLQRGVIEIAPLAYMRGRTLNDAFIILDEGQNTTYEQMKMFLTRLGFGSKMVVTGDITQIDLPPDRTSGLVEVQSFFREIEDIETVYLTHGDVVRHRLVQEIIKAYEVHENNRNGQKRN